MNEDTGGLLFRLSGEKAPVPDCAAGNPVPNFFKNVETLEDGEGGRAIRCLPNQLLAYWAPGNIYAQRGSLSFFWRSRSPLGETPFPLFRVSFADHSSWDALFLRVDYNGSGIDAFVTDINLSRLRLSYPFAALPAPDRWTHIGFAWDETVGVRLYVDGKPAGALNRKALLFAGLDQFGTHSRVISNAQVQSSYNYVRTGDFREIRIYGRMLEDEALAALAAGEDPVLPPFPVRNLAEPRWREEWLKRWGFDSPVCPAPLLHRFTSVRKVEIHNAWDHKRWWWKGCDGIRETTWPGVYNRSRLPGRTDYFVLPDWDCYSVSGKEITFEPLADEYFNHIEMSGSAAGLLRIHGRLEEQFCQRREASERSVFRLAEPVRNVSITFTNDEIEEPIGDLSLFEVEPGTAPGEAPRRFYTFSPCPAPPLPPWDTPRGAAAAGGGLPELAVFIRGRFTPDEGRVFLGAAVPAPAAAPLEAAPAEAASPVRGEDAEAETFLPLAHYLLPYNSDDRWGMDGLILHLPALKAAPGHDSRILVNVQIKDPLWLYRNLVNFTFAFKPGSPKTIWFDTRDRLLPPGKTLYFTVAFSSPVGEPFLGELKAELVYKSAGEARREHIADRWIQVKDNYANLVEENPASEHFNLFNRFKGDLEDLLRADPEHHLGKLYRFDKFGTNPPDLSLAPCPPGLPLWAWRQAEYSGYVKRYIRWWIDKRQIANGEFGGGLSDDGDLTAWWPGPALAGYCPDKIAASLRLEMAAFYDQGMFSNGLCAIQTDQLHTLEEGIQVLGQCLTLFPASPKYLERAMENARGLSFITGYNAKGHRHILSGYYSGTVAAREAPWNYSASDSFHVLHPAYMLVRYNGSPAAKKLILELADAMMDHYYDDRLHVQINVDTDTDTVDARTREWPLFYAAWKFTGDRNYLKAIDSSRYAAPQDRLPSGEDRFDQTAERYEKLIRRAALREYINTDGQLWVDRGVIDIAALQEDRIGGVGHERFSLYPRHYFRWRFEPGRETGLAVLVTHASPVEISLTAYNMTDEILRAEIIMEDILPGLWEIVAGGEGFQKDERELERFAGFSLSFRAAAYTVITMKLISPGIPYWERPDLGIGQEDLILRDDCLRVLVHSLGAVPTPASSLVLRGPGGEILRSSRIPPLPAPDDLYPKTVDIPLWTRGLDLRGCSVELDPEHRLHEITRMNNIVHLDGKREAPP